MNTKRPSVKFLIIGAGAIGGFIGACLSRNDKFDVTLVARGPHYKAMKESGLYVTLNSLSSKPESFVATSLNVRQRLEECVLEAPFDVVFLAVKAHQLIDIARDKFWRAMIHEKTLFVPVQNGLPWYLFLTRTKVDRFYGKRLKSVDPTGELEAAFESQRVIGCIAMPACSISKPGHIDHEHGWSFPLPGTPDAKYVGNLLASVGFRPEFHDDFESELWLKSLGSAVFNPVSALTGAVLGDFADHPESVALTYAIMDEVRAVAKAMGKTIPVSNEKRLKGATKIGNHKTSMLQDVEAGKPALEVEALVGSVIEIAQMTETAVPNLSLIYTMVRMKQRSLVRAAAGPQAHL